MGFSLLIELLRTIGGRVACGTLWAAVVLAADVPGSRSVALAQDLRIIPFDHWTYPVVDGLLLRHPEMGEGLWMANRPWRAGTIDSLLARARRRTGPGGLDSAWVEALAAEHRVPTADEAAEPRAPGTDDSDAEPSPVRYHNVVSARYRADLREDDASFDPAFRGATFEVDRGQPEHRGVLGHDFALQFGGRFALGWRYVVDTNIRNDPTRRSRIGIRGTEAAFEVLDAYATVRAGPLHATAGRQELALGPGRASSPFVSESIPALDQVRLELHADPIRFTSLVATLSRERPNRLIDENGDTIQGSDPAAGPPVPFDVTRTLYLHRVDWRAHDHLQLVVSEAAVVSGIDRGVELRFANPFVPFFVTQEEGDEGDAENVNVVAELEGVFTGIPKTRLYGSLFVQEFFVDQAKRDSIGNQLAWRLGGAWADPLGWRGGTVGAEYTRVDVFTYLHRGLNTNWTTFGVPLGSALGPDADQALGWFEWWAAPLTRFTIDLLARRGGERDVETLESVTVAGNPDFPSGTVQQEWRLGAEAWTVRPAWGLEGRARIDHRWTDNIANDAERDGDFWRFALEVMYRWNPR